MGRWGGVIRVAHNDVIGEFSNKEEGERTKEAGVGLEAGTMVSHYVLKQP